MPVSPHDFSLWAKATGNKYPNSLEEKARLAPEVHNFARNYAKPGAIGAQEPEEEGDIEQKQSNLRSNLAKAALVAGGVAAGVAAARDPRVQRGFQVAKESVINTSDRVKDFLQSVGQPSTVDMDVVNASGDVTPNPRQQQAAAAPEITTTGVTSPVTREVPGFDQDGEYIHPSRIPGMEGGDYRGRNLDTEAPSAALRQGRKDNEAGLFTRYQETGEIPPSQLSPEQKAALRIPEEKVDNIINEAKGQIKNDQLLDQKATQGTLTRAEEGAWLQNELNRSGTTPQQLFGHDSVEEYMDTYMPKERSEASPKSIYVTETDEKDIGPQHFMPGTNMSWDDVHFNAGIGKYADPVNDLASARAAVNNELIAAGMLKEGGTLQPGQSLTPEQKSVLNPDTLTNLKAAHQASQNLAQVEASGEPGVRDRVENLIVQTETPKADVTYSLPEAVENDRTNSLLASSVTPDNQIPKVDKDLSGTSLTSQHDIEMEADNIIDIAKTRLGQKRAQIAESTGMPAHRVDEFLGKYFPSMTETYSEIDPASGPTPEQSYVNIGPAGERIRPASRTGIRGRGRQEYITDTQAGQRDITPSYDPLRGSTLPEKRPDVIGGNLPLGGLPTDLEQSDMSKQEVRQSIISPATERLDEYGQRRVAPTGVGIYGHDLYPSGSHTASGEYTEAAGRRPTELSRGQAKFEPKRRPMENISSEAISNMIPNLSPQQQQLAQQELTSRQGPNRTASDPSARRPSVDASQQVQEIYKTGDPGTRKQRIQNLFDNLGV